MAVTLAVPHISFNRRGDSLGGAAKSSARHAARSSVSIAGAILWGVLHNELIKSFDVQFVSIAGAILWGVLPGKPFRI